MFADDADRRTFVTACANSPHVALVGRDEIRLIRRSDVFVSMARFSEGSIFDRSCVWRGKGYLQGAPRGSAAWLSNEPDGLRIAAEALAAAPHLVQTMPAPYLRDFQRRIAARYAGLRGPANRRLLVARRGSTRTIANLAQVQALLWRHDFETVYLEGMSMADQILLFQGAAFIIGPHGVGLVNLLFCEPGTKVIELMPPVEFRPFFWLISEKLGLVHGVQFCPTTAGQGFQGALSVDVAKLQALIRMVDAASAPIAPEVQSARPARPGIG